jgi:Fe-S oxidoreductase
MSFTDQERKTAIESCRFCPMCHHADLITTLTRRETYSARGRGVTLFAIEKGKLGWDASVADVMYKSPADGLLRRVCAGHIRHDDMVIDARRRLVKAGAAPGAVAEVRANVEKTGNPWGVAEPDLAKLAGASKGAATLVYFGPAARVKHPLAVAALSKLLRKAGVAFSVLPDEGDPGLVLYQLGEAEAAGAAARALQLKIEKSGAKEVVVQDADAARVLGAGFEDYPGLPKTIAVRPAAELLATLAKEGTLKFRASKKAVGYHDPCALARFAPCLEAPRALVKAVTGKDPLELAWNRDLAACSGECGGLPFTNPDLARAAAERRRRQAAEAGADLLVTAGAAAAAALGGGSIEVKELSELAADCLVD